MGPTESARAWRQAPADGRGVAWEELAAAVLQAVLGTLRQVRLPEADALDLAQDTSQRILGCIDRGEVSRGAETGFTIICARNAAWSWFRRAKRSPVAPLEEEHALLHDDNTPEHLLVDLEEEQETRRLVARVEQVMKNPRMPAAYRQILEEVYMRGTAIERLVSRELSSRGVSPLHPSFGDEFARARNVVDQRLSRARKWVRNRM